MTAFDVPRESEDETGAAADDGVLKLRGQHLTDLGNAERFVDRFGDDLRYVAVWGAWLVWDGKRWARDRTRLVHTRAAESVRADYLEASRHGKDNARKWAYASEKATRLNAIVEKAREQAGIPVLPEELDADPTLLNLTNGTYDLTAGKLREHRRDDLITKLAPVAYDPDAECPTWLAFLERVLPNPEDRAFVQRATGYSLTGSIEEHVMFMLRGGGRNGKSTFIETLLAMLGDYAGTAPSRLLLRKGRPSNGPTPDLADLQGRRLVATSETGEGRSLDEELIKQITTQDTIKAERKYEHPFEFKATHKLWLSTNYEPRVKGTDEAIWSRFRVVPFDVFIPPEERDKTLGDRLRAGELPGIMRWGLEGLKALQEHGLGSSGAIDAATKAYRERQDVLGQFLTDRCLIGDDLYAPAGPLYNAYKAWAQANSEEVVSSTTFGTLLTTRGFPKAQKWLNGKNRTIREGLSLRDDDDDSERLFGEQS
jgi:putative DNA primase/helicase